MSPDRARLELRMELHADEERMSFEFYDLGELALGEHACHCKALFLYLFAIMAVEFITVAVAFVNKGLAIELAGKRTLLKRAGVEAQAHSATFFFYRALLGQEFYDRVFGARIEFCGMGIFPSADVPREFDDCALHAEADAEEGDLALAGVLYGFDLSINAAVAESSGDKYAVYISE